MKSEFSSALVRPHTQSIFWLADEDRLDTAIKVDQAVSVEIPPATILELRDLVFKHMIHGPFWTRNPRRPCMERGSGADIYSKHFPKISKLKSPLMKISMHNILSPLHFREGKLKLKVSINLITVMWCHTIPTSFSSMGASSTWRSFVA